MIREWGTFLNEDLAQERILAELEGRTFDKRDFFKRYTPRQELAILDKPMSDGGDTMHEVTSAGDFWMAPRVQGGGNAAEERMVRRLDREPTIAELRAEGESRPWQSYVHAASLENAEEALTAWLEFVARMTPDEYTETNIEAQIEAILPGLTTGEILRCARESLGWSERDLERHASVLPGTVRGLEQGKIAARDCPIQALAAALSAVAQLEPGILRDRLAKAWGYLEQRTERRAVIESDKDVIRKRRAPLTYSLGEALELRRG